MRATLRRKPRTVLLGLVAAAAAADVLAVLNWLKNTKGWFGDITLGNVQFGYEITSSSGGLNFTTNSFSVTSS